MINVTQDVIQKAKSVIASSPVRAAGYRIKVLLLDVDKGLSAGEAEIAPTLAKLGFESKSDNQKKREDKGTDMALIVDIGEAAWCNTAMLGDKPWAKEGQVIRIARYAGHSFEEPPGSGNRYALLNDEDIYGYYQEGVTA